MAPDSSHVEVRQHLKAVPARVFSAFAEAHLVAQWLRPSPDVTLSVLQFEFREGGAYRFAYHLPEGHTVLIGGTYRRIEPPAKIVFSWIIEPPDEHAGIESEVTVTLVANSDGTDLVIRHQRLTLPGAVARHAEGWRGAIGHLSATLEVLTNERNGA